MELWRSCTPWFNRRLPQRWHRSFPCWQSVIAAIGFYQKKSTWHGPEFFHSPAPVKQKITQPR